MPPLITLAPVTTRIYQTNIPAKMRGLAIRQAQQAEVQLNLLDANGDPVNLVAYGFPSSGSDPDYVIKAGAQEAVNLQGVLPDLINGSVVTPTTGTVKFTPSSTLLANPGVYIAEIGAFFVDTDSNANLILSNQIYLFVERGMFSIPNTEFISANPGPPTLNEIRLALRDSPEGNRLTDEYEFDIAEIADAMVRAILQFNAAPPRIDYVTDTFSFPWRLNLLEGICAFLFETAATYYRRAHLAYQGGGIAVDDLNKAQEYTQVAQFKRQMWEQWVRMTKASLNMDSCFSTFGSTYPG